MRPVAVLPSVLMTLTYEDLASVVREKPAGTSTRRASSPALAGGRDPGVWLLDTTRDTLFTGLNISTWLVPSLKGHATAAAQCPGGLFLIVDLVGFCPALGAGYGRMRSGVRRIGW